MRFISGVMFYSWVFILTASAYDLEVLRDD